MKTEINNMSKAERTKSVLLYLKELPKEFYMIKGILLAEMDTDRYDISKLAERMDEIRGTEQ